MAARRPRVAIVTANFNGASALYRGKPILWHCLTSMFNTDYGNCRVFVGDDSSTDDSVPYMRRNFPEAKVVLNKPNGGYTRCANKVMKYALKEYDPDYIALMNNDVIIKDRSWLSKLVGVAESDGKIAVVGCKFLYPDGRLQHAGVEANSVVIRCRGWNTHDADKYNEIEEVPAVGMVVCLISRAAIHRIGLLDENFYQGSDDLDFCVRAKKAGFEVVYDGQVSIVHLEGYTAKAVAGKKRSEDFWFTILQINFVYSAFKRLGFTGRAESILLALVSCFIGIGNRQVKLSSVKFKSRPLWRLKETLKAISIGYKLYKGRITRDKAYGPYLRKG